MRLLHLLPVILIIAAVTAALKVDERERFPKELLKTIGSLLGGFAVLAVVIFFLGRFL
jgi:hypothetical protein